MKVKALRKFKDVEAGADVPVGRILEWDEARYERAVERLAPKVNEVIDSKSGPFLEIVEEMPALKPIPVENEGEEAPKRGRKKKDEDEVG